MRRFLFVPFFLFLVGCQLPQVVRPLRLYDLKDGTRLEVFLETASENSGALVSASTQDETFRGEYVIYDRLAPRTPREGIYSGQSRSMSEDASFAEMYGFGKESNAKPAGTAILVGSKGTVIEIVLYRVAADLQFGDGVAKDNKGRSYRVFLSLETQ